MVSVSTFNPASGPDRMASVVLGLLLTASRHRRSDSPTLTWSSLQHLLENAVPHVLIILDCCFAANAARDTSEGTTKELLAACGRENPTSDVGKYSFTAALIEELQAFGSKVRGMTPVSPVLPDASGGDILSAGSVNRC